MYPTRLSFGAATSVCTGSQPAAPTAPFSIGGMSRPLVSSSDPVSSYLPRTNSTVVFSNITLAVAGPGAEPLLEQIAEARQRGSLIGFDMNYRSALWPDVGQARSSAAAAAAVADIVVASADDVAAVWAETPENFCERMAEAGVRTAIVTNGPGSIVARSKDELLRIEPPQAHVVDATGAGDAFFGTFLAHHLAGNGPQACCRGQEISNTDSSPC